MSKYNTAIKSIMNDIVDKNDLIDVNKVIEQEKIQEKIEQQKRKLMRKIAKKFWDMINCFKIDKNCELRYETKDYHIRWENDDFCLWSKNEKILTGYTADNHNPLMVWYRKDEKNEYIDLLHIDLIKEYYFEIKEYLINKIKEDTEKLINENEKQEALNKLIIEHMDNW